jgi:hypothetical protein
MHHDRFVREVVEQRAVWTLWGRTGPLVADSNAEPPLDVYLFFSTKALAADVLRLRWPTQPYTTRRLELFDFLYRWLSGMHRDGHLCGTNWTAELGGVAIDPFALKWQLVEALPADVKASYEARLVD